MGLIMGPNITCWALVLMTTDLAQTMYIGNLNKPIWALITYIGPGPEVLSSDRPTIYNHAPRVASLNGKQVGNDSLPRVPIPHTSPFTTMVTERRSKVLIPETVMH